MTCKSCDRFRLSGCLLKFPGWPDTKSVDCVAFIYFPGSDEAEDEVSKV